LPGCSGTYEATDAAVNISLPGSQFPVFCYMQLTAPASHLLVTDLGTGLSQEESIFYYDGLSTRTSIGSSKSGLKKLF